MDRDKGDDALEEALMVLRSQQIVDELLLGRLAHVPRLVLEYDVVVPPPLDGEAGRSRGRHHGGRGGGVAWLLPKGGAEVHQGVAGGNLLLPINNVGGGTLALLRFTKISDLFV